MRVKKDKCYLVVTKSKEYIQGAFPYNKEGKIEAKKYMEKIEEENLDSQYKIKVG